ncbi:hypothetical protein ACWJJH_20640 [Endozoicomonadaceae bacterium StTr2]
MESWKQYSLVLSTIFILSLQIAPQPVQAMMKICPACVQTIGAHSVPDGFDSNGGKCDICSNDFGQDPQPEVVAKPFYQPIICHVCDQEKKAPEGCLCDQGARFEKERREKEKLLNPHGEYTCQKCLGDVSALEGCLCTQEAERERLRRVEEEKRSKAIHPEGDASCPDCNISLFRKGGCDCHKNFPKQAQSKHRRFVRRVAQPTTSPYVGSGGFLRPDTTSSGCEGRLSRIPYQAMSLISHWKEKIQRCGADLGLLHNMREVHGIDYDLDSQLQALQQNLALFQQMRKIVFEKLSIQRWINEELSNPAIVGPINFKPIDGDAYTGCKESWDKAFLSPFSLEEALPVDREKEGFQAYKAQQGFFLPTPINVVKEIAVRATSQDYSFDNGACPYLLETVRAFEASDEKTVTGEEIQEFIFNPVMTQHFLNPAQYDRDTFLKEISLKANQEAQLRPYYMLVEFKIVPYNYSIFVYMSTAFDHALVLDSLILPCQHFNYAAHSLESVISYLKRISAENVEVRSAFYIP